MNALVFWWRKKRGKQIDYYCTFTSPNYSMCECQPTQHDPRCERLMPDGGTECFCRDRSPLRQLSHRGNHFRCRHCTNPRIVCRNCGSTYMDKEAPGPQWSYDGLFKGWSHTGKCIGKRAS